MKHDLIDQYGRTISHLRLSLTDRCNFKCSYCLPDGVLSPLEQSSLLTLDQIKTLTRIFCELGITRIRLTGGEPLVRNDILDIVKAIKQHSHVPVLALTTNGSRLAPIAKALRISGLDRINISLDSLTADGFRKISKQDCFEDVIDGILSALSAGLPVKINTVVMKGQNDHEIDDFIQFGLENSVEEVRFIEFMPLCGTKWNPHSVLPFTETIQNFLLTYPDAIAIDDKGGVAEVYRITKGNKSVRVGFIRTLSKPFCGACSRIRISADGILRPCLFSHDGHNLKPYLVANQHEDMITAIHNTIWHKQSGNEFATAHKNNIPLEQYLFAENPQRSQNPSIRTIGG